MALPADSHVHSEWSWDALDGSMERTCARAVELGLPAVAFTEHADYTMWTVTPSDIDGDLQGLVAPDGTIAPPELDLDGYLECVHRCRDKYPELRILTGVEFGQPHLHPDVAKKILDVAGFDRVLGSLHVLAVRDRFFEPPELFKLRPATDVVRDYLAEVARLIAESEVFAVLAHIDYAVRYWPDHLGPYDPSAFEDEFRHALRVLADNGRALEVNTAIPLHQEVVRWWREGGGDAVTFGSDAHDPMALARGFADAAAMVESEGFRPGRHPYDFWTRTG